MLDGYIDEPATYQCSCSAGELSDVQITLLIAIVGTAESFVTITTLLNREALPQCALTTRLLSSKVVRHCLVGFYVI